MLAIIFSFLNAFVPHDGVASERSLIADSIRHAQVLTETDSLPKGKYVSINRIFITGNRITRDRIILRELSVKTGDVMYTDDLATALERDRKKLLNTRLFNTVEIRSLELEEYKVDILIDLNERWYTFPAPLIDLADRNFNEWWKNYNHDWKRINYGLRLFQYNMRGRNETLRLHAQFGFQRRFEVMYRFPYIDKKQKHGLSVDFNFLETKNLAYKTADHKYVFLKADDILRTIRYGGATYTYRNTFYQTHSLRLEYLSASIDDTVKLLNPNYYRGDNLKQRYGSLTYMFQSDHRDFFAYPLRGHYFSAILTKYGLQGNDDLQKIESTFTYSKYMDLQKQYYLSNNTVLYLSNPDNLAYANYGVLGMRRQFVRGYELYVIEGPFFALNKTTFKKLIFSETYHWDLMPLEQFRHIPISIYLKSYVDIGYVKNYPDYESANVNGRLSDELLTGAGLGLDIIGSYDVVFRIEYSINREKEQGFFFHLKREF